MAKRKKKTTIELLIWEFKLLSKAIREVDEVEADFFIMAADLAKGFLPLEKTRIEEAFVECWKHNVKDGTECKLSAKEYYNKTYGK